MNLERLNPTGCSRIRTVLSGSDLRAMMNQIWKRSVICQLLWWKSLGRILGGKLRVSGISTLHLCVRQWRIRFFNFPQIYWLRNRFWGIRAILRGNWSGLVIVHVGVFLKGIYFVFCLEMVFRERRKRPNLCPLMKQWLQWWCLLIEGITPWIQCLRLFGMGLKR